MCGGFLFAVRVLAPFPSGGACSSQGRSLTSVYQDGSAWEIYQCLRPLSHQGWIMIVTLAGPYLHLRVRWWMCNSYF